ncbi:MAG TPA: PAS domain S-box protein [Dongiaceae bacterium]|nr:PAS domain S-box protein [Dongiaceae bacterium]
MGIYKGNGRLTENSELRRNAEEQLKAQVPEKCFSGKEDDYQRLVQELEVHKIELELQNAELRRARYELETALEKYTDLFEFAPVGYLTLDRNGVINAVNLAGAGIIGGVRTQLIGRYFRQFITTTHRHLFDDFLGKVLTCRIKESCEVALLNSGNHPVIVQIEGMATASGHEFRLVLIDITEQRRVEGELAAKKQELEELSSSRDI